MLSLKARLVAVKSRIQIPHRAVLVHRSEHFFHAAYLAAVSWDAHGLYAQAATVLLVVTVVGFFVREDQTAQRGS